MTEKEQLIIELREITQNNFEITGKKSLSYYVNQMLAHIGDTDPELRDELIYFIFNEWICEKDYFNNSELAGLMDILLDDKHLFYKLGNQGDNSVYTRSFSILVIVLIISRHRRKPIFTGIQIEKIKNKLLNYYSSEKDLLGYNDVFGWAHAAAHGSDVMDELVQCRETGESVCKDILEGFKNVLQNGSWMFSNEEDERIARVVYRMIRLDKLPGIVIAEWLEHLSDCCSWEQTRSRYIAQVNSKNFVRSLYFKIQQKKIGLDLINTILDVEEKLNRFYKFDKDL